MSFPFIQAVHSSAGHNLPLTRIVIHGTVSGTHKGGARANAAYFQEQASGGSAQYLVDPAEIVQAARDDTVCWHAPPNPHSIGIEFCDWVNWEQPNGKTVADLDPFWRGKTEAQFNARWDLPDWVAMLRLGAGLVHSLGVEYHVPLTRIGVAQLLNGAHGLCGHVDVSEAWHQSDHTDPGWSFPWATFMGYVLGFAGSSYVAPPPSAQPHVQLPAAGVLTIDGGLGPATIRRWQQIMKTTVDSSISLPDSSLVRAVQTRLNQNGAGLAVDGAGIVQDGRVYQTVAALQRYLSTPVDGKLSAPSSAAVKALQARLNTGRF